MLVVVEIAATMILLTGSALLITSVARLMPVDPGFGTEGTLTFRVLLTGGGYAKSPGAQQDLADRTWPAKPPAWMRSWLACRIAHGNARDPQFAASRLASLT